MSDATAMILGSMIIVVGSAIIVGFMLFLATRNAKHNRSNSPKEVDTCN